MFTFPPRCLQISLLPFPTGSYVRFELRPTVTYCIPNVDRWIDMFGKKFPVLELDMDHMTCLRDVLVPVQVAPQLRERCVLPLQQLLCGPPQREPHHAVRSRLLWGQGPPQVVSGSAQGLVEVVGVWEGSSQWQHWGSFQVPEEGPVYRTWPIQYIRKSFKGFFWWFN